MSESSGNLSLDLRYGESVEGFLAEALLDPVGDLFRRPSKGIRGELVDIGYAFADGRGPQGERACKACRELLESLHAGTLAIDDIQDGSLLRRGEPTLHRRYGIPLALNAGNWLYFKPLQAIRELRLDAETELGVYRHYHDTLLRAHYGQALDLGVRIDEVPRERVYGVCLASLELKSGLLTALALVLGAVVGGAEPSLVAALERFGRGFGIALQMFDDLGNLTGKKDPSKRWEDLRLRRPSWWWAWLSRQLTDAEYGAFVASVRALPEEGALADWLARNERLVDACRFEADEHLTRCDTELAAELRRFGGREDAHRWLQDLGRRLRVAYE